MRLLLAVFLLAAVAAALEVRDWNDRTLGHGTVAVYDEEGRLVALSYVVRGDLVYGVPWRRGFNLRVAWGAASLEEVASGRVIWVYDSAVFRDVIELGAPTSGKIRTWVYPITITIREKDGKPLAGCYVRVVDILTGGRWLQLFTYTASDGSASLFQAPATDYNVDVFCGGYLVATAKFSVQRGAPSTAWNFDMVVDYVSSVKVSNAP
ncbi:MAG: carboxypeptidase-like regulatory domain-containing protein [Pyrobaculum sp.]